MSKTPVYNEPKLPKFIVTFVITKTNSQNSFFFPVTNGQIHTVQKHTQNRPRMLRSQDKQLFSFEAFAFE